jgi:hypothetical protein
MNLEFKGTSWEGAVLATSARGFYCPANVVACYGVTGEQVLDTLSQTVARNVTVEDKFLEDCMCMLAIAFCFKIFFGIAAVSKCYDGKEVKPDVADRSHALPTMLGSRVVNVKNAKQPSESSDVVEV